MEKNDNINKMTHIDLYSCSAAATSNKTKDWLEGRLQVTNRHLMQPPQNKQQIFFIDDINMSYKDKWQH